MSIKETALPHGVASDEKIAAIIFQHITQKGLTKIQVRIPRSSSHVSHRGIQSRLMALAKRQQLPAIDFSCRTHSNPLDEITGETFIRFHFSDTTPAEQPSSKGFLAKLKATVSGKPATPVRTPPLDSRNLIAELEDSLKLANVAYAHRYLRTEMPEIMHVAITARDERFKELLAPMSAHDLSDWCAGKLRKINAPIAQHLTAAFRFAPYRSEEGTDMLGGGDLEIELHDTAQPRPSTMRPTHTPPPSAVRMPAATTLAPDMRMQADDSGTLPPDMAAYVLELRIEFPQSGLDANACQTLALPACINRETLTQAGLGKHDPDIAQIASQSTPLSVDVSPTGYLMLSAGVHKYLGEPMYYLADNDATVPISVAGLILESASAEIFVNAPQGTRHPTRGHLPPVRLHLSVKENSASAGARK